MRAGPHLRTQLSSRLPFKGGLPDAILGCWPILDCLLIHSKCSKARQDKGRLGEACTCVASSAAAGSPSWPLSLLPQVKRKPFWVRAALW